MFGILLLLFTVIPAIEIYLLIKIGGSIGGFNTILVVVVTGIIGASLAKSQGLAVLQKIQGDINQGQLPADQIIHGLLVFGGGLLLLTPGFLTDFLGLSMVFPGTRHIIVLWAKNYFKDAIRSGNIKFASFGSSAGPDGFKSYGFTSMNQEVFDEQSAQQENETIIDDENVIEVDFKETDK